MKTRKRAAIKNIVEPEDRPTRKYLNVLQNLLNESDEVFANNASQLRALSPHFKSLLDAFNNLQKPLRVLEAMRAGYTASQQLNTEYVAAQDRVALASSELSKIKSDALKHGWERQLLKLTTSLHLMQMNLFNQQRNKDIQMHKRLREAEKVYDALSKTIDEHPSCLPANKHQKLLQEQLAAQKAVVSQLESKLNEPIDAGKLEPLQKEIDALNAEIEKYTTNRPALLAAATQTLKSARLQLRLLDADLTNESLEYYNQIDPVALRHVVFFYSQLLNYQREFDTIINAKPSLKLSLEGYQQRLSATIVRVEKFMHQFRSSDFRRANASELYAQFSKMSAAEAEAFMKAKPTVVLPSSTKVSTVSVFKPALTTDDKRNLLQGVNQLQKI